MPDTKTPAITWPTNKPVLEPRTPEEPRDTATSALQELDDIAKAAGGFPGDRGNAAPARLDQSAPTEQPPADMPPLDLAAEKAAYAELLKFFADTPEEHTQLTTLDADLFGTPLPPPPSDPTENT